MINTSFFRLLTAFSGAGLVIVTSFSTFAQNDMDNKVKWQESAHLKTSIAQAITLFEKTPMKAFSYRVSRYENEEGTETSSIELYSPHLDNENRWELIEKNNRQPTLEEKQSFIEQKRAQDADISVSLSELIVLDSLRTIAVKGNAVHAHFDVQLEKLGAEASSHLKGELIYDANKQYIQQVEVTNVDSFSPMFAASINTLKVTMTFIQKGEAILPTTVSMTMKGRFAFVSEINETSSDRYSDYIFVGNVGIESNAEQASHHDDKSL